MVASDSIRFRTERRTGVAILEIVVAAGMLAAILVVAVQMLDALTRRQRGAERRALAIETVQAVSEQLGNMRWEELTPTAAEAVEIPEVAKSFLPNASIKAAIINEQEPVAAKRIQVELTWTAPGGQPAGPVRLTSWAFPDEPPPE